MSLAFANYYRLKNTEANYLIKTRKRLVLKAMMVVQRIIDFQYQSRQFYIGVNRKCPESFYPIFLQVEVTQAQYRCDPRLMEKVIAFSFF